MRDATHELQADRINHLEVDLATARVDVNYFRAEAEKNAHKAIGLARQLQAINHELASHQIASAQESQRYRHRIHSLEEALRALGVDPATVR